MRALAQQAPPPDLVVMELDIVRLGALRLRAARRQQPLLQLRHGQLLRPGLPPQLAGGCLTQRAAHQRARAFLAATDASAV
jgi:hypothetical protein